MARQRTTSRHDAAGATAEPPVDAATTAPLSAGPTATATLAGRNGHAAWLDGTDAVEGASAGQAQPVRRGGRVSLEVGLYLLLGLLALLTRFFDLGSQAQHHDESLHSFYSWMYYVGTGYQHDPLMHGPLLFHLAALSYFLFGDSDATSRYAAALFGAATVLLPYLLRRELGRWGALTASVLLLVSPSFLYFGRFHRHDVYSAFLTCLLFAAIVRFIATPRPAWAFIGATAWGLLFTNKEDFFIVTAIFGSALAIAILWRAARQVLGLGIGLVVALGLIAKVLPKALGWPPLPAIPWEHPTSDAIRAYVMALLSHPVVLSALLLLAAFALLATSIFSRIARQAEMVDEDGESPDAEVDEVVEDAAPRGAGWVDNLFGHDAPGTPIAALHALLRDQRTLWTAAGIATGIYVVLYTSLFSNIPGIFSGSFGAIGYWLGQQGVQRAEQPWFYYFLLLPQYDPLAALLGGVGVALTGWRLLRARLGWGGEGPQPFARGFIAYWAVMSLAIYAWAGEKMPWMDIHMVMPLTLLAATLLGSVIEWLVARARVIAARPAWGGEPDVATRGRGAYDLVVGGLIVLGAVAWFLVMARFSNLDRPATFSWSLVLLPLGAIVLFVAGYGLLSSWGRTARVALLALSAALLLYHVHAGWSLAYERGDVPIDMLVYVQTSPDVTRVMREIDEFSAELTGGKDLAIMYDSNTSWPFQWYLRDYRAKQYFDQTLNEPPGEEVAMVLVGAENLALHPELTGLLANYSPQPYAMRWHFPEDETYRTFALAPELRPERNAWSGLKPPYTLADVLGSILSSLTATAETEHQARLFRLLAYRDLGAPLGSYDFTVYVRRDLLPQYNAIRYR